MMPTVSLPPETLLDGSTVEDVTICLVDECAPDFCEFQAGTAGNRNNSQYETGCAAVVDLCEPCTTWGECWG